MPRPPGIPKTGGRKPGHLNKVTREVKEALEECFEKMGGVKSLVAWASLNPTEFYKLWAKLIPKDINVKGAGGISVTVVTGVPQPEVPKEPTVIIERPEVRIALDDNGND